mgnify:FL=1
MDTKDFSKALTRRLPEYYEAICRLESLNIKRISSAELANFMNLGASQVRQDFSRFGGFGQQGYGYNVDILKSEIGSILGIDRLKKTVLIGAGILGCALLQHIRFESSGFQIIGIFDKKESLVGKIVKNIPIRSIGMLDEFCLEQKPEAAILCTPQSEVQEIAEQLEKRNVKGFLNFSGYDLKLKNEETRIENIRLSDSLLSLSLKLNK